MLRRYELTDQQWEQIASYFPTEYSCKRGRPLKDNRLMLNAMIWIARSGVPWRDLPECFGPRETVYSRFRKWIDDGFLDNIKIYNFEDVSVLAVDLSEHNVFDDVYCRKREVLEYLS